MDKLIARKSEIQELERLYQSSKAEFVVVYGRRRIGKTYLVNKLFSDRFVFTYVGSRLESAKTQLSRFARQLRQYRNLPKTPVLRNWDEAFNELQELLESMPTSGRKVIFFDEMPWIDTPRSRFVSALEYFWNSWASKRDDIMFIACGSATSWMINKLVRNRGGMYNRITSHIYLRPFTLSECEEFLDLQGCNWDRYTILQCYMAFGGVPFYLSMINPRESLVQNIDRLCFSRNGILHSEFDELFNALFEDSTKYSDVAVVLSTRREGLLRNEIIEKTGHSGGTLTKILDNLERCDFISKYSKYKSNIRNVLYRLSDPYLLFYFKFLHTNNSKDEQFWSHNIMSSSVLAWQGYSFEMICLSHLQQIKKALGINGMATNSCSWRKIGNSEEQGTQIDLLIERADRIINVCEIKFSQGPYNISKDYERQLRMKMSVFSQDTHVKKPLSLTMITTFGVAQGKHSGVVNNEVIMDQLFDS